jgi:hypothetical protein
MFLGLLLDIANLLCHTLKRILVVGILELELCIVENTHVRQFLANDQWPQDRRK